MAENDNTNKWKWFFLMPMKTIRIFATKHCSEQKEKKAKTSKILNHNK